MATVVYVPPDPNQELLARGAAGGVANFLQDRRNKAAQEAMASAFREVANSASYDDAIKKVGSLDPAILSNPEALKSLTDLLEKQFPQTETLEVLDKDRESTTINFREGHEPSDE